MSDTALIHMKIASILKRKLVFVMGTIMNWQRKIHILIGFVEHQMKVFSISGIHSIASCHVQCDAMQSCVNWWIDRHSEWQHNFRKSIKYWQLLNTLRQCECSKYGLIQVEMISIFFIAEYIAQMRLFWNVFNQLNNDWNVSAFNCHALVNKIKKLFVIIINWVAQNEYYSVYA